MQFYPESKKILLPWEAGYFLKVLISKRDERYWYRLNYYTGSSLARIYPRNSKLTEFQWKIVLPSGVHKTGFCPSIDEAKKVVDDFLTSDGWKLFDPKILSMR